VVGNATMTSTASTNPTNGSLAFVPGKLGLWEYCAFLNINPRGLFLSTLLGMSAALVILPFATALVVLIAVLTCSKYVRVLVPYSFWIRYISVGVAVRLLLLSDVNGVLSALGCPEGKWRNKRY
jgi:hypothetical protein